MATVIKVQEYGNSLKVLFDDDTSLLCITTGNGMWLPAAPSGYVPPVSDLIDTISPGHSITNPGGTVPAAWQWHIDNNSHRGGVDWNYNFATFTAPGAGTVTHFDVAGVGMVVKLVLDTPAPRIDGQLAYDQYGPMQAIWFQHCSAAVDGHANQGDIIGTSGNGYGAYGAHLHVHGQVNTLNTSGSSDRCNFWEFT